MPFCNGNKEKWERKKIIWKYKWIADDVERDNSHLNKWHMHLTLKSFLFTLGIRCMYTISITNIIIKLSVILFEKALTCVSVQRNDNAVHLSFMWENIPNKRRFSKPTIIHVIVSFLKNCKYDNTRVCNCQQEIWNCAKEFLLLLLKAAF